VHQIIPAVFLDVDKIEQLIQQEVMTSYEIVVYLTCILNWPTHAKKGPIYTRTSSIQRFFVRSLKIFKINLTLICLHRRKFSNSDSVEQKTNIFNTFSAPIADYFIVVLLIFVCVQSI
jgi:hypothetical protein